MKKQAKVVEFTKPRETRWVILPNEDYDKVEIEKCNSSTTRSQRWVVWVTCTTPYKLPGMIVQALAEIEALNGNEVRMESARCHEDKT